MHIRSEYIYTYISECSIYACMCTC